MPSEPKFNYPTIHFEGVILPTYAATLDTATTNDLLNEADIEAEWAVWWWRFCICIAARRRERSSVIIEHANRLRQELTSRPSDFLGLIDRELYGFPIEIYQDWLKSINMICEIAKHHEICEWVGVWNRNDPNHPSMHSNFDQEYLIRLGKGIYKP